MVHLEQAYSFPKWRSWISPVSFPLFCKPPLAPWLGLCLLDPSLQGRMPGNIHAPEVWWHFSLEQELDK